MLEDAVSINEVILQEFQSRTCWISFPGSVSLGISETKTVNCFPPEFDNWTNPGSSLALPLQQHFSAHQKKKKKHSTSSSFAFDWNAKCQHQHFLLASFLILKNCRRWEKKMGTCQFVLLFINNSKQFLLHGEGCCSAILTQWAQGSNCLLRCQTPLENIFNNSSFLLRTTATL